MKLQRDEMGNEGGRRRRTARVSRDSEAIRFLIVNIRSNSQDKRGEKVLRQGNLTRSTAQSFHETFITQLTDRIQQGYYTAVEHYCECFSGRFHGGDVWARADLQASHSKSEDLRDSEKSADRVLDFSALSEA